MNDQRANAYEPSETMHIAQEFWARLWERLPLDPELARRCNAGKIEAYLVESFDPMAEQLVERAPHRNTPPICRR